MSSGRKGRGGHGSQSSRSKAAHRKLRFDAWSGAARRLRFEALEVRAMLSASAIATPMIAFAATPFVGTTYTPAQLLKVYDFPTVFGPTMVNANGAGQTIAIVDAYNDPNIAIDLAAFDTLYGLPALTGSNFIVEGQTGALPGNVPAGSNWGAEISLDVEWTHALAPDAKILLVEANSAATSDLLAAVTKAASASGVVCVTMGWGVTEADLGSAATETSLDATFTTPANHLGGAATAGGTLILGGITFVAAAGNSGSPGTYPAYSPNVLAVGGTSLNPGLPASGTYTDETTWNDADGATGAGISVNEKEPTYQDTVVPPADSNDFANRAAPDVAFDADPETGVEIVDSFDQLSTDYVGGTSLGAVAWSALIAIADQGRAALAATGSFNGFKATLPELYAMSSANYHDITTGDNGTYDAAVGYDLVTGRGTPDATAVIDFLLGFGGNALNWPFRATACKLAMVPRPPAPPTPPISATPTTTAAWFSRRTRSPTKAPPIWI